MAGIYKFADLREYTDPRVSGCPPALVNQALYAASREFCERSRAWEEAFTIDLIADTAEYDLLSTWQAGVEAVKEVRINTTDGVAAGNKGLLLDDRQYTVERSDLGAMARLVLADSVTPTEAVTSGLTLTAILVPTPGEHTLPGWFIQRYHEAIIAKALYELMRENPDDAWYNPGSATYWFRKWQGCVGRAKSDVLQRGRTRPRGLLEDDDDAEQEYR